MKKINIAIDGPAGAGKSTIAKILAKKLDYTYIDTGAMYRALTYLTIKKKIDSKNEIEVASLLENEFNFSFDKDRVILNKEDITLLIRSKEVDESLPGIVKNIYVRKIMVQKQRELAAKKGVSMDGRDIASVVLPDAELKIFLTASLESRVKRRYQENIQRGIEFSYEDVLKNLQQRDYTDTFISKALVKTADAIEIDTTDMTIDEVVTKIMQLVETKVK